MAEKFFSTTMKTSNTPCAMTIAGSDSGGGAGIQADMLAFAANGVYATCAIAAITAQNPDGVPAAASAGAKMLEAQMEAVENFYKPKAAKTGMLFDSENVAAVSNFFEEHRNIALVVDPVMLSTSGSRLLSDSALEAMKSRLIGISTLFTPNIDEAEILLSSKIVDIPDAAQRLRDKYHASVLLKGGHLSGNIVCDFLAPINGGTREFKSERITNIDTHGSGCTLSAAIAARLALGEKLELACENARKYLLAAMKNPVAAGGRLFINHFPKY